MLEVVFPIDYPWVKVEVFLLISAVSDCPTQLFSIHIVIAVKS